jgi:hypothetical protein
VAVIIRNQIDCDIVVLIKSRNPASDNSHRIFITTELKGGRLFDSFHLSGGMTSASLPSDTYDIILGISGSIQTVEMAVAGTHEQIDIYPSETTSSGAQIAPTKPAMPSANVDSVDAAINRIAGGTHQELPAPMQSPVTTGQNPGWAIENGTGYALHLYLSGPVVRDYVIPTGQSISIDLPPGNYRIAADVPDPSVLPFYALRVLPSGIRWTSHFYIGHR